MPACLIDQEHGVRACSDVLGDFGEMQVHDVGIAFRQNERRALAFLGRDRAEDIGRRGSLIVRRAWPRAAFRPSSRDLVLLTDARFVGEPDFYLAFIDAFFARDFVQAGGERFLKSSIAPSACA